MNFYQARGSRSKWPKVLAIAAAVFLMVCIGAVFAIRKTYHDNLKPVSSSGESVLVEIPKGATPHEIATLLDEADVIRAAWAFEWFVRNEGARDKLKFGTYALRPNQNVKEIVGILTQGQIATDLVTILPGQRLTLIRDGLINAGFDVEAVDAALDPKQYANHPALVDKPASASLEGYLYPESFQRTADTKPQEIIRASLDELQKKLTPALRAKIVDKGLNVHEALTLASIVEQEAQTKDDRRQVAQVFYKRLEVGMQLGSDVTTRYAINKPTGPLTVDDINSNSPYNTRQVTGLPPGPISNFGETSLDAVINPAKGDYLFFVTGNDGITRFSRTVEEHDALASEHGALGE